MKKIVLLCSLLGCLLGVNLAFSQKTFKGIESESFVPESEQVVVNERNNAISFVVMKNGSFIEEGNHLNWLKTSVLKSNSDHQLVLYKKEKDELGFTHYRYKEYYKGIKVEHGVYYVHVKDGRVVSVNGEFYPEIQKELSSVTPKIDLRSALSKAKTLFKSSEVKENSSSQNLSIIFNNNTPFLCYHFELSSESPLKHSDIYIDAQTNKIILEVNKIHTTDVSGTLVTNYNGTKTVTIDQVSGTQYRLQQSAKNLYTKNCNNGSSQGSAVDFTNATSTWTASTAINKAVFDLHYGLEKTYDYYYSKFSRNSYDGNGAQIRGIAHYGSGYNNAFWNGTYLTFGDGDGSNYNPFSCTDIVGHELTHAVTESSAGLIYMDESGGLNESFSDIFGVAVDFYANPATANFLEGEQCSTTNTPFRNMTNPNATQQPDTYLGQYWVPSGGSDNGGVHTNSQVQNYWFYLLCQGGSGTNDNSVSYSISGIGISDAEKIAYRNLTNYLTPNSTFADARTYAVQSAIDLFGSCSNKVTQCANAWYAVGVGSGWYSNAVVSNFSSNNNYSCSIPASISFINNSVNSNSYIWYFGDGTTSTAANPAHTYTAAGNYNVKLKAIGTSSCNSTDSITKTNFVTITNIGSPISACTPVQGNNSSTYGITKVEFGSISKTSTNASEGYKDFMCTNQSTLTAGNPYLLKITTQSSYERVAVWIDYNNDGTLNATNELILNSVNNLNNIYTHTVVVQTPTNVVLNTPLRLRVSDDYNSITSSCATHAYGQTEDYTVRFFATTTKPQTNFYTNTRTVQAGSTVNFYDSTLNAPTSWKWTFQGGSTATSTAKNPTLSYPSAGTYSVKLVATNSFGADSITKTAYINVVNTFNLCAGTNSTSSSSGTLYDSGGPTGGYLNYENCQFLINTGCTGTITVSFTEFQMESCCDYLSVYNGTSTAAPLLGTFNGTTIPPTLTATSGKMFFNWTTDGSVTYNGFTANWSSVTSGTVPPVANFAISNTNPALNTNVQFTDQTTNMPSQWLWQFGDGTTSTLQNPIKSYSTSGAKTITLSATNCNTTSVISKTISVQGAPLISVVPNPITASVSCGGSTAITATVSNSGIGDLQYSIANTSMVNVLYLNSLSGVTENSTVMSILSGITNCSVTTHSLTTVANFQNALINKNVLLIPEIYSGSISAYSSTIYNFVNNGGTVIINGNTYANHNAIGLFPMTTNYTTSSGTMNVLDTTDLITKTLPLTINALNQTYYSVLTTTVGITDLVRYGSYPVVSKRSIGSGKAIFLGYDFYQTDGNASKILSNAIKSANATAPWLSTTPGTGTITAGNSSTLNVQFNSSNLTAGIYTANIVVSSNDPATPNYSVPVTYTVSGTASSSVSVNCKSFGSIMQYTSKTDSVTLYNTGCATMSITSLSTSNAAYTYTPSTSFTIAPFGNRKLYVKFNPTTVGVINDTLRIVNNGGNQNVCLSGTVTSAPQITVTPNPLTASVSCGSNAVATLSITNNGGSNLTYTLSGGVGTSPVNVLVIMNNVNTSPNYTNIISALNTYSTNYTITQHTLTTAVSLQSALIGKHVLLIPQPNTYNTSYQTYSTTIASFANSGGTVIMSGLWGTNQVNDIGLFNSTYTTYLYGGYNLNVIDTNDVIMKYIPMTGVYSADYIRYHTITNGDAIPYIKYGTYHVVSKRNVGQGRAILLGYDFYSSNAHASRILSNCVKSAGNLNPVWLTNTVTNGTVTPSSNSVVTYTFNASTMSAGTYTCNINVNSNDPLTPTYTVPVSFSITGSPSSSVSANCKNFGSVMQYTSKTDSLILYNTGCSTMSVSSLNTSNAAYTYTPSTSFTVAPYGNRKIYVKFNPTTVGVINDTLRIVNNGGNQNVCLSGTVTSAPQITVTPNPLTASVSCGGIATSTLSVANNGGSNLTYTINAGVGIGSVNILVIMNNVSASPNYTNIISALNTYSTNYTITQHTLTTAASLQSALIGKHVLLIPQPNTYNTSYQTYSTTIASFANSGGTVIMSGLWQTNQVNDIGLFNSTYTTYLYAGYNLNVIDTNDVIMKYIPMTGVYSADYIRYNTITNADAVHYIKYGTYAVVSKRIVGQGRAILLGYDFYSANAHASRILSNCVKSSANVNPAWLTNTVTGGTVTPSSNSVITYTFNAGTMSAGTYTGYVSVNSNDPLTPTYTVPVSFSISGSPSSSVSANCKNFGSVMQYTSKTDSLILYNTGCSTMSVSSLSTSNAAYTYTPSTSFTIAPFGNRKLYVKFNPTTVGVINDTLRIVNNGGNQNVCLSGTVTSAPQITVTPNPLTISVGCGSNAVATLSITNNGGSNLTYTATGSGTGANVKVLLISNLTYPNYITNMLTALNSYSVNYTVTQHTLTNAAALQTALQGKDIVIFPQPYNGTSYPTGLFQTYSLTINNFVNNGGTALMSGFYNTYMMNDLGLFNSTYSNSTGSGYSLNVIDTNNVITTGLPLGTITSYGYNYYHSFSSSNVSNYITYSTYPLVSKRNVGSGRAIYVGFDYQTTASANFNKVLANSVKSSVTSVPWLSGSPTSNTVTPSNTSAITYTFNSTGLAAGTYSAVISVNSNDPLTPTYTVPVTFNISGSPSSSVSVNCKNFGNLIQYTSKTDSLTLYNTGCVMMSVTSLSTSNAAYSYTPSTSFTIASNGNRKIYVKFSPTTLGVINDTLRIVSNGGNQNICLSGTVTSAPQITVTPTPLSATLSACNTTQTVNLNVGNVGGSNLTYTVNGGAGTSPVNVLVIMNNVNTLTNYPNIISALNTYSTNYTITQHTLTTVANLQNALVGKHVLLIPQPSNGYSTSFQTYSTTIASFANNGGTVIMSGLWGTNQVNDIGLFNSTYNTYLYGGYALNVIDTNDVIMKYIPMTGVVSSNYVYYNTITNGDATHYIKYGTYPVVSKRTVGQGRAILLAYDFYSSNPHSGRILSNCVKSAGNLNPVWLTNTVTNGTVTPSSNSVITYTFNSGTMSAGTYTCLINVNSNDPLTPTYTVPVTMVVGNEPCANFAFTNPNNCSGIVTFTNTTVNAATSYSWNFGNGTSSTQTNPSVTYAAAGVYSVSLTACNGSNCSTITNTLSINGVGGPITNSCTPFSYMYGSYYGILNVNFNTINKSSGYANPEGYQDFSCNNQTTLTLGNTYTLNVTTSPSYYENVSAWIDFNNDGVLSASEQILSSYNKLTTHTLSFTPPTGAVLNTPLRMRIIDEYSSYTIGSACYNSNYGQAEDYTIKIQANNVPPVAAFNTQINSCQGIVNFTDNSSNNPTSWIWNFGDGGASSLQNPTHTYTASGTYTVMLIASNAYGSNYTTQTVIINALTFNIGITGTMSVGQSLTYTTSLSGGLSYTWDFGDGNLSSNATTTHSYSAAGTYTVKLTIVSGGCVNTVSTTIVISAINGLNENSLNEFGLNVYPNPFNTFTSVKLNLSEDTELSIDILNAIGQTVKELAPKQLYLKGEYSFSTDYLAKGIYFVKLNHKNRTYTYKMISLE